jgi:hypothetical protein
VTGGDATPRWGRRDALGLAVVLGVLLLPVVGLMRYQGPPMEEGFMLVFPEQILQGRLPHRDFLHLYGPGSVYALAAVYGIFGVDITVERVVGLLQHAVVAVALYALLRPWGRRVAVPACVVSVLILLLPMGLVAMAWNGALAFATAGLALGVAGARRDVTDPVGGRLLAASGVCLGASLLFRPDLALAVLAGVLLLSWPLTWARRRPLLLAGAATLLLYVPHVLASGFAASFRGMFLEPVFELRPGRALPVPPSWDEIDGFLQKAGALRTTGWPFPMPALSQQIVLWFWLVLASIVLVVTVAVLLRRREGSSARAASYLPVAAFSTLLVTQALQRPDTTHLAWVTCISFPLAMAGIAYLVERRAGEGRAWLPPVAAAAVAALVLLVVIPFYPVRTYLDAVGQSFGRNQFGTAITNGDRTFWFGSPEGAADAQRVVDELAVRSQPGERLIAAPGDLSRTNYSDAYFYHLFPDLVPGTRYIEMDPGLADAEGSGLAEEVAASDWLILTDAADAWTEPNTSASSRSQAANQVVAEQFCEVVATPTVRLLERCRPDT